MFSNPATDPIPAPVPAPTPQPPTPPPGWRTRRAPQLVVSALLVAAVMASGCGSRLNCQDPKNAGNIGCVIENAAVDCTGVSSLPSAVAVVTPIVEKLVFSALQPSGTIKWAAIEPQLIDIALQYGMCVLADVWNQLMNGGGGGSGSGSATVARSIAPAASLAEEFNRIRARVAPGRQFKIRFQSARSQSDREL